MRNSFLRFSRFSSSSFKSLQILSFAYVISFFWKLYLNFVFEMYLFYDPCKSAFRTPFFVFLYVLFYIFIISLGFGMSTGVKIGSNKGFWKSEYAWVKILYAWCEKMNEKNFKFFFDNVFLKVQFGNGIEKREMGERVIPF